MYAIGNIIFGYPINSNNGSEIPEELDDFMEDQMDEEGILTYYSGSSDESPAAIGIELGRFDECNSFIPMSQIILSPTIDQIKKFEEIWESLPEQIKKLVQSRNSVDKPFVFVLWSTS